MIGATQVILADGGTMTTEAGEGRCWASEEVAETAVMVEPGTLCSVCGEPIDREPIADDGSME